MRRASPNAQKGFTYLMLLWWVAISGVMLIAVSRSWTMEMRRQREAELVFRGEQIQHALQSYYDSVEPKALPANWQDLLEDRRGTKLVRHLRHRYMDPITNGEWGVIKEGASIKGVYSLSTLKPLKTQDKEATYRDWRYEVDAAPTAASGAPPGASSPASSAMPSSFRPR
ncbi:MAG: type II secretion system protein [Aquabacterium sp.]